MREEWESSRGSTRKHGIEHVKVNGQHCARKLVCTRMLYKRIQELIIERELERACGETLMVSAEREALRPAQQLRP